MSKPRAIILMGVSSCGKTSVGLALSEILDWPFYDGDDFHPEANVTKMAARQPLNDDDRAPWLTILHDLIHEHLQAEKSLILACSALKEKYRIQLAKGNPGTVLVYLRGDFDLIYSRMTSRSDHYMKAGMLQSQFDALEAPKDAIIVEIDQSVEGITKEIIEQLRQI
jgi:gluconokinase